MTAGDNLRVLSPRRGTAKPPGLTNLDVCPGLLMKNRRVADKIASFHSVERGIGTGSADATT